MDKKQIFLFILLNLLFATGYAQDQTFSQFYAAPLQLNPALTGVHLAPRISFNYRNQWPAMPNAYTTYAASYDQQFPQLRSGFGLQVFSDNAGDGIFKTNRVAASYAYIMEIGNSLYMRGGLEAAFEQKVLNWDKLIFLDQIDPINGPNNALGFPNPSGEERPDALNRSYVDFSAGLLVYSSQFYGGAAIKHINSPSQRFLASGQGSEQLPILFSLHGGAEINLGKAHNKAQKPAFISPNILFTKQQDFHQLNVGAYASVGQVFGGLWLRHTFSNADAVILLGGFQYGLLKVGYSYDWTISRLKSYTGGAHEVSLILNFENTERFKKKSRSSRYNDCLKMFK